jgi:phage tail-like protein
MSSEFKFRALTREDWKEVNESNLIFVEGLKLKETEKDGIYTSEPLDSGISDCSCHRIVLDAYIPENSTITVSFIISETEKVNSSSGYEKPIAFTKATDALIQAPPGRYIRLIIHFHREGKESPVLRQVKVYYERLSYLRYLPAIYQENSESKEFLERFLSIFESSMFDSEEMISSIPMYFDPMAAPEDFYRWLADWMSLDLYDLLDEDKKRKFILNAVEFYKKKGTVSGLASLVSVLTGKKCCIKEYKNNIFRSWGMDDHWGIVQDEENDGNLSMSLCGAKSDQSELDKLECTKFYRRISKTVNTDPTKSPNLLANRGKYCDEIHYITGTSQRNSKSTRSINYFSNSIDIFVFYPFGDKLQINEKQLGKIIDSFLPVFVTFDIIFVETSLNESYPLSWINDEYSDQVKLSLDEGTNIQYIQGEYTNKVKDWNIFYTYCKDNCPNHPANDYGHTYSENEPEYKNYRTVHGSVGFALYV